MTAEFPRVRNRRRTRAIVAASVAALVATGVLVGFVVQFASQRPDDVNLGDKEFVVGRADVFARRIAEQDAPILFKDPLTQRTGRELYVQHLGDDEKKGWSAIEAYSPGERKLECILQWSAENDEFVDPCSKARYPADGTGLRVYPGKVDDRTAVVIDLRTRGD